MLQSTDVFVIGGGPAGLAAAIAARQRGFSVTLADGAQPPIDKPCGEGLLPDALAALRQLGVVVDSSAGFAFHGARFVSGATEARALFPGEHGVGVRRRVLHLQIVERAREAGVSLLWNTAVTGLCSDGVLAGGKCIAARWIVGADGIGSRVRKWSGLDQHSRRESRYAFRRHYRVKPWSDCMEVHWGERTQAYVTPVGAQEVCVVTISRNAETRLTAQTLASNFPELADCLARAETHGAERGAVTMTHRLKNVYRGRVALIGDASGSVDAITGEGLCLGFYQAIALADALAAQDLRRYQQAHRRLARRPEFMSRLMLLLNGSAALRKRTLSTLAAHPELFSRLLSVHVGATSPAHFAATGAMLGWRLATA